MNTQQERHAPSDTAPRAKRVTLEDIRNVIVAYFCLPRLYVFYENFDLLYQKDFRLAIDELTRMQFIYYFKPSIELVQKAFAKTQGIQARGDFLYFNEARNFTREGFHLEQYSLLFGPFPKRIHALQLQKVITIGGGKPVAYSICIEKRNNCMLMVMYPNNYIKNEVKKRKGPKDKTFMASNEFTDASCKVRSFLKSDQTIGGKEASMAWPYIHCFECDAEIVEQAMMAIRKK